MLTAMSREDQMGYDVMGSEDTIPADGMGDITVHGAMYHVWMDDGMLMGARFDAAIHTATDMSLRIGLPTLSGDDDDTVGNEAGTMLNLNGEDFPISDLLEDGMAMLMGKNFVAEALAEIQKLRGAVDAYIALDGTDDDTGDYDAQIRALWNDDAQADINSIFGTDPDGDDADTDPDPKVALRMLSASDDAEDAVEAFDALITALSGADAFAAATEEDGDGVLEKAALSADDAMKVFDAVTTVSAAALGTTENTRFGAYWQQKRNLASDDPKHVDADQDTDPGEGNNVDDDVTTDDLGKVGVFAYSVIDDVTKTIDLPTTGNLHYAGETVAVSGGESPAFYFGEIEIQVRLVSKTVHGLVSNLRDADGDPWEHSFGMVDSIRLTPAKLGTNADWKQPHGRDANINYSVAAGSPPAITVDGGFNGELTGQEDTDDPARAAHGTWWIAESQGASTDANGNANQGGMGNMNLLTGAFGAERVEAPPEHRPDPGAIDASKTSVLPAAGDATAGDQQKVEINDDGELVLTIDPDTTATDSETSTIKIAIADLMDGEETTLAGATHVAETIEFIEEQRSVLQGWIALDDVDGDGTSANTLAGRDAVWTAIRNRIVGGADDGTTGGIGGENSRIFAAPGTGDDARATPTGRSNNNYNFMAGDPDGSGDPTFSGTNYPRDGSDADDVKGLQTIDELLVALSSADDLEEALDDGGIFHDGVSFSGEAAGDIFGRVVSQTRVMFSSTDYTRFGAWRRESSPNAETAESTVNGLVSDAGVADSTQDGAGGNSHGPGVFAFSPLEQTKYTSYDDPSYPIGGTARYSGETIAVQMTTFYQGTIDIVVMWEDTREADGADFADGDVAVTISNLVDVDGVALTQGANDVASIVISGTDVTTRDTDNAMGITIPSGATGRVVHANRSVVDATGVTASLMGKFVGKTIDGPIGVIGSWTAQNTGLGNGGTLRGAFGAEASGP